MSFLDAMIEVEEVPDFDTLIAEAPQLTPEEAVRRLLLRLAELEAHQNQVKRQARRIADVYQAKLEGITDRVRQAREALHAAVVRNEGEKIAWPDLGTVYLTKTKPAVTVLEPDGFKQWALDHGYVKEVIDETAAKKAAVESVLADGVLPEWAEFRPAGTSLAIRMAHLESL